MQAGRHGFECLLPHACYYCAFFQFRFSAAHETSAGKRFGLTNREGPREGSLCVVSPTISLSTSGYHFQGNGAVGLRAVRATKQRRTASRAETPVDWLVKTQLRVSAVGAISREPAHG